MAIEQGVVIKPGSTATTAWVITTRSSACESCASRDSCKAGATDNTQEVEAVNSVGAKVGDQIQLAIHTGSLLKATFLLYLFPIICMLAGAIAGNLLAMAFQANPSVPAALGAAVGFVVALCFVRIRGRRMGAQKRYQPKIIRVLARASKSQAGTVPALDCEGTTKHRDEGQMQNA